MKKVLILFMVVITLVLLTGCISVVDGVAQEDYDALKEAYDKVVSERDALLGGPNDESKIEGDITDDGYLVRSVTELIDDLEENALNAKEFYTKKKVEITGRVDVIDASGKYICLYPSDNEWALTYVQCFVKNDEQKEGIKNIAKGDIVTLKGEITMVGEVLGYWLDIHSIGFVDSTSPSNKFDEESVLQELEVTEYSYSSAYLNYAFLVIKNNSKYTLDISASVKFYNGTNELIGADDGRAVPVASGSETVVYFTSDEKHATMEYELSVSEPEWLEPVVHDLTYETTSAKNKEIVTVKNNGDVVAEFVQVYALFFNGDNVVGFTYSDFGDEDYELKPGKTSTKELKCYDEYTSVRFFAEGCKKD